MQTSAPKTPAHEIIYRRLRDMILFGDLAPGQAITIQGLVDEFAVSMTPVREAIRRLTAEGALELKGNRRVQVPVIGPKRFEELSFARLQIEPKLAEIAAKSITRAEIDVLSSIDAQLNLAIAAGDSKGYMLQNHRFHFHLYAAAQSAILMPIAETLWLRFGPLYRVISGRYGTANLVDQHHEALECLSNGDAKGVAHAIAADIEQGLQIVFAEGLEDKPTRP